MIIIVMYIYKYIYIVIILITIRIRYSSSCARAPFSADVCVAPQEKQRNSFSAMTFCGAMKRLVPSWLAVIF